MRKYIIDLTNHLIAKNGFALLSLRIISLRDVIKTELECTEVHEMKPETLGKIMASFEIGDVMMRKEEIFNSLHFNGDCEDFLREQVALFLACVIRDRLFPSPITGHIPPYERTGVKFQRKRGDKTFKEMFGESES